MQKQYEENVWEMSNDTYSLSVRVQTTINHISIYFWPQHQRQRKCFSSERELNLVPRAFSSTILKMATICHFENRRGEGPGDEVERELKKALRDTLTRAAWYGL